jgi:2-polyprenyl-3-methyl-5-hydroxy-6-metoxy-1,4-benzoquinol methylase
VTETIGCPLCDITASRAVIEENGFTGRQCSRCGLIYVSPRPTREEMADLYAEGDAFLPPEFFIATAQSLPGRIGARHNVRMLTRHVPRGSLLEIGPGAGTFLVEARRQGFDVHGVELNPRQAEFISGYHRIPCVTSLAAARELGSGQFDVVYHRDVISHFYDPIEEMRELAGLIRPGGYHVFETGNLGDVAPAQLRHIRRFQYPDHLFFYSERSLEKLLRRTGFELVHTHRYSMLAEHALRARIWKVTHRDGGEGAPASETPASAGPPPDASPSPAPAPPSGIGRAARDAVDLGFLGLRLTLGRVAVRPQDIQSLIVVARRTV